MIPRTVTTLVRDARGVEAELLGRYAVDLLAVRMDREPVRTGAGPDARASGRSRHRLQRLRRWSAAGPPPPPTARALERRGCGVVVARSARRSSRCSGRRASGSTARAKWSRSRRTRWYRKRWQHGPTHGRGSRRRSAPLSESGAPTQGSRPGEDRLALICGVPQGDRNSSWRVADARAPTSSGWPRGRRRAPATRSPRRSRGPTATGSAGGGSDTRKVSNPTPQRPTRSRRPDRPGVCRRDWQ